MATKTELEEEIEELKLALAEAQDEASAATQANDRYDEGYRAGWNAAREQSKLGGTVAPMREPEEG